MKVKQFVFHDKEYKLTDVVPSVLDVHISSIKRDSIDVPLYTIQKGEDITAVSYADAFKSLEARNDEAGAALIKRFPSPEPIDEVYLNHSNSKQKIEEQQAEVADKPISYVRLFIEIGIVMLALLLSFFLWPTILFAWYRSRAKNADAANKRAYWVYRTAGFYLHQLGYFRGSRTPMQYARELIDPELGTSFTGFLNIYLKQKYAKQPLTNAEQVSVTAFLPGFLKTVRAKIPAGKRVWRFLNPLRAISFFVSGEDESERNTNG